jgi:formate transporter
VRGLWAGALIAFGGLLYTLTLHYSDFGFGLTQLLGGLALSIGFVLAFGFEAEIFSNNILTVMAWIDRKVSTFELFRRGGLLYFSNLVGALMFLLLVQNLDVIEFAIGNLEQTAVSIASEKLEIGFGMAFVRGVLCGILVCMSVWLGLTTRELVGKITYIVIPVTAFAALGFEHSIANMYLIPSGLIADGGQLGLSSLVANLVPVTLGNIFGVFILACALSLVYMRKAGRM